jgi:hypothetical protein
VRPSIQPSSRNRCTKAAVHWLCVAAEFVPKNPMVGSFAGCCARAASGHATAAPPSSVMNWRRLRSGRYRDHCQWEFLIDLSCFE